MNPLLDATRVGLTVTEVVEAEVEVDEDTPAVVEDFKAEVGVVDAAGVVDVVDALVDVVGDDVVEDLEVVAADVEEVLAVVVTGAVAYDPDWRIAPNIQFPE